MVQPKLMGLAICSIAFCLLMPTEVLDARPVPDKPNIIFILADDQGWNGTSVQMHPEMPDSKSDYYKTPNLEKLANAGLRFSDAYAPGPMCSPTRASLQTGKSPAQLRMTNVGRSRAPTPSQKLALPPHTSTLSVDEITIGEILQRAGYATAWFGKWHLGGDGPGSHGYDEHDGPTGNADGDSKDPNNPKDIFGITERGMAFMEKNAKAGKPFYVQLWHYAVHGPIQTRKETQQSSADRATGKIHSNPAFAGMTEDLDTGIGMILDKIAELNITDNTYIVYMSDHGAGRNMSSQAPLRSGKGTLWEGGLRVPLIIRGPGVATGTFCDERVVGWDLFPTFCDLADVDQPLPNGLEGSSLKPLFATGKGQLNRKRTEIAFHFPHYGQSPPQSTILIGDYKLAKLYETDEIQLFDLKKDIGEKRDLAKQLPDQATSMHRQLNDYLQHVKAGVPKPNPEYDSTATAQSGGRRGGGGAGRGGGAGARGGPRSAQLAERKMELQSLEEAFNRKDTEKVGKLIADIQKRLESAPQRPGRQRPGSGGTASPREQRLKSMKELETAFQQQDTEKVGQLIAAMKKQLDEQPARPAGRGPGRRGGGQPRPDGGGTDREPDR